VDRETEDDLALFPEVELDGVLTEGRTTGLGDEIVALLDLDDDGFEGSRRWLPPTFEFPLFLTTMPRLLS
jgi:hypothetical protein